MYWCKSLNLANLCATIRRMTILQPGSVPNDKYPFDTDCPISDTKGAVTGRATSEAWPVLSCLSWALFLASERGVREAFRHIANDRREFISIYLHFSTLTTNCRANPTLVVGSLIFLPLQRRTHPPCRRRHSFDLSPQRKHGYCFQTLPLLQPVGQPPLSTTSSRYENS